MKQNVNLKFTAEIEPQLLLYTFFGLGYKMLI